MKENSIEEDIKIIEKYLSHFKKVCSPEMLKKDEIIKVIQYKEIQALQHILSNYKKVLKGNEELENITDKMIDYIMIHQQVKTMRKIFCKHCKLQNSCTYSGIHRNCVIRYFEYISKQGNISKMHEELEKILESEE